MGVGMKALIDPRQAISQITSWELVDNVYEPVYTTFGVRICEVRSSEFPVAEPLFWTDCADDVLDWWYYDTENATCYPTPEPAPDPNGVVSQPQTSGGIETL